MRFVISHFAIALLSLAVSTTGALAASAGHGHGHGHSHSHSHRPSSFRDNSSGDDSANFIAVPILTYQRRLSTVLQELQADNQRLDADRMRGRMPAAEYENLKSEATQIRDEALGVADRNGGIVPAGRYDAIQRQVFALGRAV
ncbi:hypothetical protein [Rhizobium sp. S96]|uniref:hypothetical protein n=1 Tax=Rhizobium sp. S96 TaxID=3055140 RepID=UPI0025AA3B98|nr:hypothetical protein [Rhizobium sp. S96]MDM9623231.1 hypothetical protein [Rhizobium sp. S96]